MSTHSPLAGVIPMARAIDHYFDLALYLLVCTGFETLASTGGLDLLSIVLVAAALAVRGYMLAKRRRFAISERWTTPLSIAYFAFFAADYILFSRAFLPTTVHLALFGVVVRMFSLRRERDHVTLAILAFLMVLAAAVLTVNSIFLFSFALFMMMAVGTFVLMEMRRSGHAANIQARHSNDPQEHRHLAFSLARVAPALMLMILFIGAAVFFVMPRMSAAGYLGDYSFGADLSSGFSDRVQLGQIGQIQQSNAVVMHIQIDGDKVGRYDLHWRGVALSNFDGTTWSNVREQFILPRQPDHTYRLPRLNAAVISYGMGLRREQIIHYRVLMEPIGTNVFFLAPWARSLTGDYRTLSVDSVGAVYNFDSQHPSISRYEAESDIAAAAPAELRTAGQNYPAQIQAGYLRPPPTDPRVRELATQITSSASTNFDKAAAIENYLR
jgi:protein-glutamine gamma-glutamyltransferase